MERMGSEEDYYQTWVVFYKPVFYGFDKPTLRKYPFIGSWKNAIEDIVFNHGNCEDYPHSSSIVINSKSDLNKWFVENKSWYGETLEKILKYEGSLHESILCKLPEYCIMIKKLCADDALIPMLFLLEANGVLELRKI